MNEVLSLLVWCRHDRQSDTLQLQVVNADTGKEVRISEGSFLLRVFSLEGGSVQRCFIRHVASGREAYVQGGSHLRSFVKACLLHVPESSSESSISGGQDELQDVPQPGKPEERTESSPSDKPEHTGK